MKRPYGKFESRGASRGAVASAPLASAAPACCYGAAQHRQLNFATVSSNSFAMNPAGKRVYKIRKHRTVHKYVGRRRKVRRKNVATTNEPTTFRPNHSVGDDRDDFADSIDAAANFVSASQKKIVF